MPRKPKNPSTGSAQGQLWGPQPDIATKNTSTSTKRTTPKPRTPKASKPRSWGRLWNWPVVGTIAATLYGVGANAMYGHDRILASILYFLAILLLTLKFLTWEERKNFKYKAATTSLAVTFAVTLLGGSLWWAHSKGNHSDGARSHLHILGFNRSALVVGGQLFVNVAFQNDGQLPLKMKSYYRIQIDPTPKESSDPKQFHIRQEEIFDGMINNLPTDAVNFEIGPQSARYYTDFAGMPPGSARMAEEDINRLRTGEYMIHFMGHIDYTDSNGKHAVEYCGTMLRDPPTTIMCNTHNSEN